MNQEDLDWEPPSEAEMKLMSARRERSDQISKLMSGYLLKGYKMLGSCCDKCDTILLQDRQGTNYCVACSELDCDTDKDNPAFNQTAAIAMARELEMASAAAASVSQSESYPAAARHTTQSLASAGAFADACEHKAPFCPSTLQQHGYTQTDTDTKPKLFKEDLNANLSISSIDVQCFPGNSSNIGKDRSQTSTSKCVMDNSIDSGFHSAREKKPSLTLGGGDCNSPTVDSVHVCRLQEKISWASRELETTHSLDYSVHLCQLMKIASEAIVSLRNARM